MQQRSPPDSRVQTEYQEANQRPLEYGYDDSFTLNERIKKLRSEINGGEKHHIQERRGTTEAVYVTREDER
jgi:hypothetical protein